MEISLAGKRVLVTGATGAMGGAIATQTLESGAWVAGSYFTDEVQAQALKVKGAAMLKANLTDRAQARGLVEEAWRQGGRLDALIYAAGNTRDRTIRKMTDEEWDEVFKLHLQGLFVCCRALIPLLQDRGGGKILALGSLSGFVGRVGQANYSAAKAGIIGFIKSLAKEAGRFGVTANVICPGFVDSKMTRAAPAEVWERARADSALGCISSVKTVASFAVWLLSDWAQGITGQVFHLDSRF